MHAHAPLSCAGRSRRPLMLCDCNPQGFFLHYWMSSSAFVLRNQGIPTFACFSHSLFAHLFPSQPPQRVCCMKVRLSSPRHPARDYDTTASADNRTYCLEEPNEPIWGSVSMTNYSTAGYFLTLQWLVVYEGNSSVHFASFTSAFRGS